MADFMTDFLSGIVSGVQNLPHNLYGTFLSATQMSAKQWIRIIIIMGAYLLLRPYLLKYAAKAQEKQYEKTAQGDERARAAKDRVAKAKISPNSLRGQVEVPEDTDEEEEEAEGQPTGANWGKKARKRQRQFVKKVLEEEERRAELEDDSEDEREVEEFLVKYTSIRTELEE